MPFIFLTLLVLALLGALAYFQRHHLAKLFEKPVNTLFHYYYYRNSLTTWADTHWMGVPLLKLPLDLWIYQEILWETRPDLIVETGTNEGGSALYFANLFDVIGNGRVITIDIARCPNGVPQHPRIEYVIGSSTDSQIVDLVRSRVKPGERVMVVLDSDHSAQHVRRELDIYAPLVAPGAYLIVEDTNVNGHPVFRSHGPGPMEALNDFLAGNPDFASDLQREKFKVTFSPKGWLKRSGLPNQAGTAARTGHAPARPPVEAANLRG